ncbi:MAG TPA: argininosuccinate synthase [Elusimicrobia bacterium]|nr:argininosuccinate synthase [Elusimicrobiota bacterium]
MRKPLVVLAFSGGLDTTFCLLWLKETLGARVVTATVDTGGFSEAELKGIEERALALGAERHHALDAQEELFERFAKVLIQGNILRGRVYPLSVAAERVLHADRVARLALELGADALAHGSTGAGNDQVRFDGVFRALAPGLPIHAPIRSLGWTREAEVAWLAERGVKIPPKTAAYSVNAGLWGTTVGGRETHDPWVSVPESAYPAPAEGLRSEPVEVVVSFEAGVPVALDGRRLPGAALVGELHALGRAFGLGRGVHLGDTVLGIKGRIGFEAPAPLLLIFAHQELEKLVLTRWQGFWKNQLADFYGQLLHEGLYFDPVMRDIEALISSSQQRVCGETRLRLAPGRFEVGGVRSPFSLAAVQSAAYGETSRLWSGEEAAGFAKLHGLSMSLALRAGSAARKSGPRVRPGKAAAAGASR